MDNALLEPMPEVVAPDKTDEKAEPSTANEVKRWLRRITSAEQKWQPKFDEMKSNMDFVAGFQWDNQTKLNDDRYINNIALRLVNQKVASLYARNPTATVKRRHRMDFQLWDEDVTEMAQALEAVQMSMQAGVMPPIEAMALIQDYEQGRQQQKIIDRVCKTLEKAIQYQWESHYPDFKEQMKQLVRRVVICKVGYVKVSICRYNVEPAYDTLSTTQEDNSVQSRTARAQFILEELQKGDIDETSPDVSEIKSLVKSLGASQNGTDFPELTERLDFDFPPATSIIPSEECRNLKDFISATFVAQKYVVDTDLVEALFDIEISSSEPEDSPLQPNLFTLKRNDEDRREQKKTDLYEVFNVKTKERFFVAKGYKDYVLAPESVEPQISGFWPIFALTFNDIEGQDGTKAGIFPPSDVDLVRAIQKEWNRVRNGLRDQRNANQPKYLMRSGLISEDDEDAITNAKPNTVIKLQGLSPEMEPDKVIKVLQVAAIDPAVYDTGPLEKDMLMAVGMQQANVGPAEADVTATVGTIAEQSRLSGVSSNVDDLDGLLTRLAKAGVEIIMRGFSQETVKRIVGPGAALPTVDVDEYLNAITIKIVAASSGRPNKAMEVSQMQQLVPLLIQAGSPPGAIVREIVRRWDDQLDVDEFLPVIPPVSMMGGQPPTGGEGAPQQQMLSPGQQSQGLQSSPVTTNQ